MVVNKLNLSLNEPFIRQAYAKQGDTGRVFNIEIDPTPTENGTLRIKRPDGVEVTSSASSGGEEVGTSFSTIADGQFTALATEINPIQDLHGQSSPYPAGGKGNLLPNNATDGTTTLNGITLKQENGVYSLSGTASDTTTFTISLATSVNLSPSTNKICFLNSKAYAQITVGFTRSGTRIHYWSISPANRVVSGWTDTGNESIDGVHIQINSGVAISGTLTLSPMLVKLTDADPTDFAPYSNICPIYPFVGKNLAVLEQGSLDVANGNEIPSTTRVRTNFIPVEYAKQYIASSENNGWSIRNGIGYSENKTFLVANEYPSISTNIYSASNSNIKYVRFIYSHVTTTETCSPSDYWYQLEKGSTATPYVPYNTQTVYLSPTEDEADATAYNTTLPQIVYGGTLDVVSGKLTVTHGGVIATTSNTLRNSGTSYYVSVADSIRDGQIHTLISNAFKAWTSSIGTGTPGICFINGSGALRFNTTSEYATVSDMLTAIGELQFVYELATPTVIDLTPQQISTLLGENNIFSDSGDVVEVSFSYDGMYAELPSQATSVVGRCIGDVELNGVSTMPFTLVVQKNNQA